MLKTYRIIPLVFILFLFGFTFITVSPVIAEDSPEFVACQQIKPQGNFKLMRQKKNCFRDVARSFQGQSGNSMQPVAPTDPSGGEVAQLNARIVESQSQVATLTTTNAQLQEQLRSASAVAEPLNARIDELEARLESASMGESESSEAVERLQHVQSEVQYLCKMSGGGTIESIRWLTPLTNNLKRMCIPSTANGYGYEVK